MLILLQSLTLYLQHPQKQTRLRTVAPNKTRHKLAPTLSKLALKPTKLNSRLTLHRRILASRPQQQKTRHKQPPTITKTQVSRLTPLNRTSNRKQVDSRLRQLRIKHQIANHPNKTLQALNHRQHLPTAINQHQNSHRRLK